MAVEFQNFSKLTKHTRREEGFLSAALLMSLLLQLMSEPSSQVCFALLFSCHHQKLCKTKISQG